MNISFSMINDYNIYILIIIIKHDPNNKNTKFYLVFIINALHTFSVMLLQAWKWM